MEKMSCKIIFIVLLSIVKNNDLFSQTNINIQKNDTIKEIVNSLNSDSTKNKSEDNFCGCESVEQVKNCEGCFEKSGPVLKIGYEMSYVSKTIIRGSCWGFVNAVYNKSGLKKETIFSSKKGGPYAKINDLLPGDWIYHVNYSYGMIEHSAIFVCWKDKLNKQAITLSYAGQNRSVPGRLSQTDLKGVYSIFRAK